MRMKILKKTLIGVGIVLGALVVLIGAIVIKQVYFQPNRNYSAELVETVYAVDNYEDNAFITRDTQVKFTTTKPESGKVFAEIDGKGYFVFENVNVAVEKVEMYSSQGRIFRFTASSLNGAYGYSFALYSLDWSKGFSLTESNITFLSI